MDRIPTSVQAKPKAKLRNSLPLAAIPRTWCVEINTAFPNGRYYFGPFNSRKEAEASRSSYVDRLCRAAARGIVALIKPDQPDDPMSASLRHQLPLDAAVAQYGTGPQKWF
jgi:Domain of unknown function (DUF1816)